MYLELFKGQAQLLKALANERRLEIVQLIRDGEMSVGEIAQMLGLPQANVSQHLIVLKEQKIVCTRKDSKNIFYKLANKDLIRLSDLLSKIYRLRLSSKSEKEMSELPIEKAVPFVTDPVCQMRLSPKLTHFKMIHNDHQYFFCASGCIKKFTERPEQYAKK